MEKAVLKTLVYADIFDYPLKAWEIHKWLIGGKLSLRQVENILGKLENKGKIGKKKELYFLKNRSKLVEKRIERQKYSKRLFFQATIVSWFLRFIPGVKLIGISGALSMNNAQVDDDIDLFVVTGKNRLWLVRLLILLFLTLILKRRYPSDLREQAAGKFCLNTILEEDQLLQDRQDLYTAHEVLQMKVLWQFNDTYSRFLEENNWAFSFLPNWIGSEKFKKPLKIAKKENNLLDRLNFLALSLQKNYMRPVLGQERITDQAVYFHPFDFRKKALDQFKSRVAEIA